MLFVVWFSGAFSSYVGVFFVDLIRLVRGGVGLGFGAGLSAVFWCWAV